MASLDQHRGYSTNHYGEVSQFRTTEYVAATKAAGYQIIREPLWNKGTYLSSQTLFLTYT